MVKQYEIKQELLSVGERFVVNDHKGWLAYQVTSSILRLPKDFYVTDRYGKRVSRIEKRAFAFLPQFILTLSDGQRLVIKKKLSFLKTTYVIEGMGITVQGDLWDKKFELRKERETLAKIHQEWFQLTSTYKAVVYDESYTELIISLVIAINYVKEQEAAAKKRAAN